MLFLIFQGSIDRRLIGVIKFLYFPQLINKYSALETPHHSESECNDWNHTPEYKGNIFSYSQWNSSCMLNVQWINANKWMKNRSGGTRYISELENRQPIFYSINIFVSQIKLNEKLIILGPFYERTVLLSMVDYVSRKLKWINEFCHLIFFHFHLYFSILCFRNGIQCLYYGSPIPRISVTSRYISSNSKQWIDSVFSIVC